MVGLLLREVPKAKIVNQTPPRMEHVGPKPVKEMGWKGVYLY